MSAIISKLAQVGGLARLTARSHKGRHSPFVELVHRLKIPETQSAEEGRPEYGILTSRSLSSSHLQSRPGSRSRSSE